MIDFDAETKVLDTKINTHTHTQTINLLPNLRKKTFSFSDVKITHGNNQLVTLVFRKATFSGVFTNLKSFMPVAYKFGLLHRSFSTCSSYEKFHKEIVLSIYKLIHASVNI